MTLQLEHINGNNRDHRLVNLCFLCPNCHTLTKTWGGRNKQKKSPPGDRKVPKTPFLRALELNKEALLTAFIQTFDSDTSILKHCKIPLNTKNRKALRHFLEKYRNEHVDRFLQNMKKANVVYPPIEELLTLLESKTFVEVGNMLNRSDNAVRKHVKKCLTERQKKRNLGTNQVFRHLKCETKT